MSIRPSKKDGILPIELKEMLPSKTGTGFGWNYFTCVNVSMSIMSLAALVIITVFIILLWKGMGVVEQYQSEIAPNVAFIASKAATWMGSFAMAMAGSQWTTRGLLDSVMPADDLEANEYARTGKSVVSATETILHQIIERETFKTLQKLQPFLTALDPEEVAALVHFGFVQMENGNLEALIELLVDKQPGSLRSLAAKVDALGLDVLAGVLTGNTTKAVMANVGAWAERATQPEQIDKLLKVTQVFDDMHETQFVNRTSETLGFVNRILAGGVGPPK